MENRLRATPAVPAAIVIYHRYCACQQFRTAAAAENKREAVARD